ncbi:maltase A3-like [Condylostylus longicornis]|uniref:maltase A3-like n=1 Tax=Condylostylus longicornis TaxID=2530218 RepID=UPI00244DDCFF|nr:maltase A3-like [Condylostylus longicornis]
MLRCIGLFFFLQISIFINVILAGVYPNFRYEYQSLNNKVNLIERNNDWWKNANFYQIYPRSFKDSNGTGIGDLKGITSKLPYLKEIGVTATWLSPIFESPMVDFGYDISDFYKIDERFGSMKDFEEMVAEAKHLGIKIILDFVPNHSSDQCDWFNKSIHKIEPYTNYYVWHKGKEDPKNPGQRLPPSNWISVFRGPAWTWNKDREEFYLHQFTAGQPDFNYHSEDLKNEMKKVLLYWLEKGVDGFRIDAVPHVFECPTDENGNFQDEPVRDGATDKDDYGYLIHNCTVDQPETLDLVYEWRSVMDDYQEKTRSETKVLLTEQWSNLTVTMKYYGSDEGKLGAHVPFNFFIIQNINNETNAKQYAETINLWLDQMNDKRIPNWVLGNHDKNRVGSRLGTDRIDMMNMMIMTLPGIAVTYQGEEIGMTDVFISWEDTKDPQACNSNKEKYATLSRDPERTPFQWNNQKNAGFSTADKTWLPMAPDYDKVNVMRERSIARSKLNIYKALRALRNDPVFKGNFKARVVAVNNNVLAILRSHKGQHYVTVMNINDNIETINLQAYMPIIPTILEYAIVTDRSPHTIGDKVSSRELLLLPKEAAVLRSPNSVGTLDNYYNYVVQNETEK